MINEKIDRVISKDHYQATINKLNHRPKNQSSMQSFIYQPKTKVLKKTFDLKMKKIRQPKLKNWAQIKRKFFLPMEQLIKLKNQNLKRLWAISKPSKELV